MTKMELLNAIVTGATVTAEMAEKASEWAGTLEKASSKPSKAQVANEAVKAEILAYLGQCDEPVTAAVLSADTGIVKGKAVALLGQLAKAGEVIAEKGKGKAPMSYYLPVTEEGRCENRPKWAVFTKNG